MFELIIRSWSLSSGHTFLTSAPTPIGSDSNTRYFPSKPYHGFRKPFIDESFYHSFVHTRCKVHRVKLLIFFVCGMNIQCAFHQFFKSKAGALLSQCRTPDYRLRSIYVQFNQSMRVLKQVEPLHFLGGGGEGCCSIRIGGEVTEG